MKKAKNNTSNRKEVAVRLYQARIKLGFTQMQTAKLARIDRKTVNRIENGHFSPSLETFFRLCQVLNVKPELLVKGLK
ncbi:MAG: XRE family transcriptional regulator [Actinobacteria bacterium]|nr:XRE family transcriptional regulator [Actinomycetota bacterium]